MFYKKPNVRYVDMAKYIDENPPNGENDVLIYEYLYHLSNMLAHKRHFFSTSDNYDYFALFCANQMLMRLTNPKIKIKSILNYLKNILYYLKVDFEQEHYCQCISEDVMTYDEENLRLKIQKTMDTLHIVEFECCLGDIIKTIKAFLLTIEYKPTDPIWRNIYISCLLSFLSSVTLSNKEKDRIKHLEEIGINKDYLTETLLAENEDVILYHLDSSMYNYIKVLLTRIKHIIALDLCSSYDTYIPSNTNMQLLLEYPLFEEDT